MTSSSKYFDAAFATKLLAREASRPSERSRWYTIHDQIISMVIELAPPGAIHLGYQLIGDDPTVYILLTFLATSRGDRSLHAPWHVLSAKAQRNVSRTLGDPRVFKATLRRDRPARTCVPAHHMS